MSRLHLTLQGSQSIIYGLIFAERSEQQQDIGKQSPNPSSPHTLPVWKIRYVLAVHGACSYLPTASISQESSLAASIRGPSVSLGPEQ